MENSAIQKELQLIREHIAEQRVSMEAMQRTQSELVGAMRDLIRVDTEAKNMEKSISAAWDMIRRIQDNHGAIVWRVGVLSGAIGGGLGGATVGVFGV